MVKESVVRGYAYMQKIEKRLETAFLKVSQAFTKRNKCGETKDTRDNVKDLEEERRETRGIKVLKIEKRLEGVEEETTTTTYHLTSAALKEEKRREDREKEYLSQRFLSAQNKVEKTEKVKERLENAGNVRPENKWTNQFSSSGACELTPNPNTANRNISLSESNRKVTCVTEEQLYPPHPDRFNRWEQVLCRQVLTGRCYWEVELSGWVSVAATYRGINRRGLHDDSLFGYNDKSWSLECDNGLLGYSYTAHHNGTTTEIPVSPSDSNRVGVYLNWPAGSLSFYRVHDADTRTHLYTFQSRFTEPLYAGFGFLSYDSSVSL